eukprot:6204150-Pleurochrysis_carterae.AAC.5
MDVVNLPGEYSTSRPIRDPRQIKQGGVQPSAWMSACRTIHYRLSVPFKVTLNAPRCPKMPRTTPNSRQPICECSELVPERAANSPWLRYYNE